MVLKLKGEKTNGEEETLLHMFAVSCGFAGKNEIQPKTSGVLQENYRKNIRMQSDSPSFNTAEYA